MSTRLFDAFLNLIYPAKCLICKELLINPNGENLICDNCKQSLKFNLPPYCAKCGLGLRATNETACPACKFINFNFDRAWSACIYEEPLKKLIHLFKYNLKLKLRKFFAAILTQFIKDYHLPMKDYDLLVSVPMHPARLREREVNHCELLTKELETQFNIRASFNNVIRIRNNMPQASLKIDERIKNVKGVFKIKDAQEFVNKNILVIDDVFTTGSTVSEISELLKRTQTLRVDVLTLARASQRQT